ncbi:MAG TPA: hypothetical protein PK511_13780 [Chitinophagales bacterium]|nr:hypothetical protein [Chitinophagales bacterium]HMX04790.1 hypothetical protein [Chitinophagales bacterium]HMZ89526.1 hypothetical protein [Chitinophagales bacterium]HNA58168.1 hypothetical protein [Chitinophagales bacterium]HNE47155.1 hypothetical protein [Chitinophagales bacterium]
MQIEKLIPVLWTEHVEESIHFYTEILPFQLSAHDREANWANVVWGEIEIMFSTPNAHVEQRAIGFTGSFYFRCTDVETLYHAISTKVKLIYPLEVFSYGMKEFGCYDNNGYILNFGEQIDQ